ncbi:hypothetical protein IR455_003089 [Salmonella enterica subsp. enterica serovar Anatum]|nr:hypothetical protein [Salmonella enterica]EGC6188612.1 hypothetical protein [Salmonella enterica]EGN1132517.1 hypothetical protein [Salmonella enterica subsp. enterica serovar Anatum]
MSNTDINDTWLVGFSAEISGVEMATNMLIQAGSLAMAEAAALYSHRKYARGAFSLFVHRWLLEGDVPLAGRLEDEIARACTASLSGMKKGRG